MIFLLFQITIIYNAWSAPILTNTIDDSNVSDAGYYHKGKCITERNIESNDDWLLLYEMGQLHSALTLGYKCDGRKCSDIGNSKDVICVAGYSSTVSNGDRKNTCYAASRGWGGSILPGNDTWKLDSQTPLPDCPISSTNWTKEGPNKIGVFVTTDGKIITTTTGRPVRSINTQNIRSEYKVKCVAYVCVDIDNNITYGNDDGSCDNTESQIPIPPQPSPKKNTDDASRGAKHIDIVTPYLNGLKQKFNNIQI